jgi:UDP-N-acetylmuramoyl-tripeptide--D-alanyl-D-alanine ligase
MISITFKELLEKIDFECFNMDIDTPVPNVSTDTRTIKEGNMYIPLKGENHDGHTFIFDAYMNKAGIAVVEKNVLDALKDIVSSKPYIVVEDSLEFLQAVSRVVMNKKKPIVVAVTGSTGKTTTKEMIFQVLDRKYNVLKTYGNYNNHIGLPLSILKMEDYHELLVLEMGMSNLGEIDFLAEIAKPSLAVITNIGESHIENLGSKDNILKAKMEISNYMTDKDCLILDFEDDFLKEVKNMDIDPIVKYSDSQLKLKDVKNLGEKGVEISIEYRGKDYLVPLKVPGNHNVNNAMLAFSVGLEMGLIPEDIILGLSSYTGSKMRMDIVRTDDNIKVINDSYNASPDSMKSALDVLSSLDCERRIAILGDMFEIGEYTERAHRKVGEFVSNSGIDILITLGKDSKYISEGAVDIGFNPSNVFNFERYEMLENFIQSFVKEKDGVLVKGSRGMKMERAVEYIIGRNKQ